MGFGLSTGFEYTIKKDLAFRQGYSLYTPSPKDMYMVVFLCIQAMSTLGFKETKEDNQSGENRTIEVLSFGFNLGFSE